MPASAELASHARATVVCVTDVADAWEEAGEQAFERTFSSHRDPPDVMGRAVLASAAISALVLPLRVGDVIARTTYRAWVDDVIAGDERLLPLATAERTELVEEFRRLDADLLEDAAAAVIEAVNARRPAVTADVRPRGAD